MPDVIEQLKDLRLNGFVESERAVRLERNDRYFRSKQYDGRIFDWNGNIRGRSETDADISPGYVVPLSGRRPSSPIQQGKKIVKRFTAMTLGKGRFPEINVHGDVDAEDFVNELARAARLESKFVEARNIGGATGTACLSWAFVDGKPRISVHRSQFCSVLKWADRDECRPSVVLKAFRYKRTVIVQGKPQEIWFYYARVWTEQDETVWDPIPEPLAKDGTWASAVDHVTIAHDIAKTPFYWIQNLSCSEEDDGESDFDGQTDEFDAMSALSSQTSKGTTANVDPTIVVKDDRSSNQGAIRKGSENAIYSKGGAEFLELKGEAVRASVEWLREMKAESAEVANIVFPTPETLAAKAQSAAALRVLYGPMLTQCDTYRMQYGDMGIEPMLRDMLDYARRVMSQPEGKIFTTLEGQRFQERPTIKLRKRVVEQEDKDGKKTQTLVERVPGSSSDVTLNWPPYFPDTWADIKLATESATGAVQGRILSRETAVKNIAPKFGAFNTEDELERIERDIDADEARAQETMEKQLKAEDAFAPQSNANTFGGKSKDGGD